VVKSASKLGALAVRPVGLGLAAPVDARLDQLLYLARNEGRRSASRAALVAALIVASPEDGPDLVEILDRYEQTPEDEVLIAGVPAPSFKPKRPGRRKL
jgi:hypothetical protein